MIAACGLDCGSCEIRLAPTDPTAARVVVDWFQKQGWLSPDEGMAQVIERKMVCTHRSLPRSGSIQPGPRRPK
jgi:hypothetical protein